MRQVILVLSLMQVTYFSSAFASIALPPPADSVYAKVKGDPIKEYMAQRVRESDPDSSYAHPYEPLFDSDITELPEPEKFPTVARRLSLQEAIALALRNNPNVKISELQRILDKFGLAVALQPSKVQWTALTFTSTLQNHAVPAWTAGTGIAVNAPTGTSFSVAHTNNLLGGMGSNTVSMTQHLMKGFGLAVNRVPYQNAFDNEKIARLNFKNSVMTNVIAVINAYRSLVQSYNSLQDSRESLKTQQQMVAQSKLSVKIGKMAPSDLLQQEENLESTHLSVVQQENALSDSYQSFLASLGLIPSTKLTIDRNITVGNDDKMPSLNDCIHVAIKNNIAYQQALLNLNITKRALITAEDARKWTLDMTSSVVAGSERSGVGQPVADLATNPTLKFSLSVPIDDISGKSAVVSAKIAIEDAKLTLEQTKENLVRSVITQWKGMHNQYQQIKISELAIKLQEKTLQNAKLKYKYGKTSTFEVNSLVTDLLTQKINLISTEIAYLNAVTTLHQTMGTVLDRWGVKLRY